MAYDYSLPYGHRGDRPTAKPPKPPRLVRVRKPYICDGGCGTRFGISDQAWFVPQTEAKYCAPCMSERPQ